jgi:hypothetical protein
MPLFAGNGSVYPSAQTTVGIALENVVGVPIAPTHILPVKAPKYKPDLMLIPDDTLQGSMVQEYDLVTGLRYDAHGWNAPPYLDSFPNLIACEFGSQDNVIAAPTLGGAGTTTLSAPAVKGANTVVLTAATGVVGWTSPTNPGTYITIGEAYPNGTLETHQVLSVATDTLTLYEPLVFAHASGETVTGLTTHQFSLLNNGGRAGAQPPSATITDYDGEEWRQLSACQLDELTLKGNGTSLVDYTCTWFGNPAVENATPPTLSAQDTQTPAPWTLFAGIGPVGSTLSELVPYYAPTILDWEFDWKRGVVPIPALTGQQAYFAYFANVLQNAGKLSFIEQPGSPQVGNFLAAQRLVIDLSLFDMKTGWAFNVHCSNAEYKTAEIDRSKEYVTVPVTFSQLPSTTDLLSANGNTGVGPCIVTIANSQTTSYWSDPSGSA